MEHLIRSSVRLEIGFAAMPVHESSSREHTFLIEHEAYTPTVPLNGLAAMTAFRLRAWRSLGTVYSRKPAMCHAAVSRFLQLRAVRQIDRCFCENLKERLRPFVRRA